MIRFDFTYRRRYIVCAICYYTIVFVITDRTHIDKLKMCASYNIATIKSFLVYIAMKWRIATIKRPYILLYNKLIPLWKCSNNIMMHLFPFLGGIKLCVLLLAYLRNDANIDSYFSCDLTIRVTEVIKYYNYNIAIENCKSRNGSGSVWILF